jgi:hypothetical protein
MSYQQPGRARRRAGPGTGRARLSRQPSSTTVIVIGAVLAVLAMAAVITIGRGDDRTTVAGPAAPWFMPPQPQQPPTPIPLRSDPSAPTRPPTAEATGNPQPVARHSSLRSSPSRTRPSRTSPSRTSPGRPPARLLPVPGSRLSLLASGPAGLRLRHQSFRMRLSPIGPASPAPARADATFVLRPGLADAGCVSLESVNFPGWFMRHRNFALLLQARESTREFAADATFCPRAAGADAGFVLRSVNFPDRHLTADGPLLMLRGPAGSAQRFHAGPGL